LSFLGLARKSVAVDDKNGGENLFFHLPHFHCDKRRFAKTGSGQTQRETHKKGVSHFIEVNLLGFPAFTAENGTQPASLTEAAQRPVYTTVSMLNDGLGNPTFGGVSAIFSNRYVANMSVIAPADTGNFEAACNRSKGHPPIVSTYRI
jgi:hypothetical protein